MRRTLACALLLSALSPARAADRFFAGPGTWDTTTLTGWSLTAGGLYDQPWLDGERAVLEGAGGTLAISGTVSSAGLLFTSGNHTISGGTLVLAAPSVDAGSFTNIVSAAVTGSAGLTKLGAGRIELSGPNPNAYSGVTTVSAGTLLLNKTPGVPAVGGDILVIGGTLQMANTNQVPDTASITVSSGLINTANRADTIANLTVSSTGQNTFSGLTVTNLLRVTAGIVHDAVNSGGVLTTRRAELSGGSVSRLGANTGASTWNVGAGGLAMTGATIQFGSSGGAPAARVVLGGDVTASGTNSFSRVNTSGPRQLDLGGVARTFTVSANTTTIGVEVVNGGIVKAGAGALALSAANTFAGPVTVNGGTISVSHAAALGATATGTRINGGNGTSGQGITLSGGITVNEPLEIVTSSAGRGNLSSAGGNNNWAGPISISTSTNLVQIANSTAGTTFTLSGDITGNTGANAVFFVRGTQSGAITGNVNLTGPAGLAKTDDGTWTIGAAGKTYAWNATSVARGMLRMGAAGVHPANAVLNIGQSDNGNARFDLNGFNQTAAGLTFISTGGTKEITNSSATPATLTVRNSANLSYGGGFANSTGRIALVKQGAGRQTLTGATLALAGEVRVEEGVLALASASANPFTVSTNLVVRAGGTLDVTGLTGGGITLGSGRTLSGDGAVTGAVTAGSGAQIAPGPDTATLATGAFSLQSGARMVMQLNTSSNRADRVNVTGNLSIAAGAVLELSDLQAGAPAPGTKFALVSYTGTWDGGVFNDTLGAPLADGSTVALGGLNFTLDYNDATDGVVSGQFVTLTAVGAASPYDAWAAGFGLTPPDDAVNADPDGDGDLNLIEFALNANPTNALSVARRAAGVSQTNANGFLYLTVPVRDGASFSGSTSLFSVPVDGVRYMVEGSADLADWSVSVQEIAPVFTNGLPAAESGWSYRTFRFADPLSHPRPRGYLRIGVEPAP